jgi:AcrR family transcriptional regulator
MIDASRARVKAKKPVGTKSAPARRLTQAERTALSDGRMFEAAMALITEHGTHNTTLKEVGEKAGYSRGLASGRFGSKDALFNELVTLFNHRWKEESRIYIGKRTGIDAFRSAIDGVVHFMTENTEYIRAMFILYYETIGSSDLMRERLAEQHAAYRRDVEKWINQGINDGTIRTGTSPERVATLYLSFLFGTIYQWLANPAAIDFKRAFDDFRDSALFLIEKKGVVNGIFENQSS